MNLPIKETEEKIKRIPHEKRTPIQNLFLSDPNQVNYLNLVALSENNIYDWNYQKALGF